MQISQTLAHNMKLGSYTKKQILQFPNCNQKPTVPYLSHTIFNNSGPSFTIQTVTVVITTETFYFIKTKIE